MNKTLSIRNAVVTLVFLALVLFLLFQDWQASMIPKAEIRDTGITGLWMLANISYAGMGAQNHPSELWRILAFLFGLPGTVVTWLAVDEGGERAYGVDLPKRVRP